MSDPDKFHGKVKRTSGPKPRVFQDGGTSLSVRLNLDPDGHWSRMFEQVQSALLPSERAKVLHLDRNAHPGRADRPGPGIYWDADSLSGLGGVEALKAMQAPAKKVDELIATANRRYLDEFVPDEEAKAEAAARRVGEHEARQVELEALAARLSPPDGESTGEVPDDPRHARLPRW